MTISKKSLAQILPGFWIGRMAALRAIFDMQFSQESEIDEEWTVITVMSSKMLDVVGNTLEEEQRKFGRTLVVRHEKWDLADKCQADFLSKRLAEILQIISNSIDNPTPSPSLGGRERPRRNCLVHCARGVSRSAAVCAAWLISKQGYSLSESLDLIRSARDVNPNMGFLAGLRAVEQCNGDVRLAQERLKGKYSDKHEEKDNYEDD